MTLILQGRRFGFGPQEIRQLPLIRETRGILAQIKAQIEAADRQLARLRRRTDGIEAAITEPQSLRDTAPGRS